MFKKILIANRGEIACRVMRTAKRLGIRSVAVFADADRDALHARSGDEAQAIDSYLSIDSILAAARASGAEAIHPGYGFLAENEAFAAACAKAGIVFIGPTPEAIAAMGDKSAAKRLMEKAGVPLVPGYHGENQDGAFLEKEAARIGFPVLIKPSAGGGGKGMRIVSEKPSFLSALEASKREAKSSFGDERVLIERYLDRPRHIEMQVFGDFRNRDQMAKAAVAAAKAIGYTGAGTVEFIAEQDGRFYFMEMNTRLQVEHPVTEAITGHDLVEWQLRVAAGEPLPAKQGDLRIHGHAIEARVCAENPAANFLPSTGRLDVLRWPPHVVFRRNIDAQPFHDPAPVRVDAGVREGDSISPFYDSMIAKLIVWGETREQALSRLASALAATHIVGPHTNAEFLRRAVLSKSFSTADLDTGLIERERAALFDAPPLPLEVAAAGVIAHELREESHAETADPWSRRDGWRMAAGALRRFELEYEGEHRSIVLERAHSGALTLVIGERRIAFEATSRGANRHDLTLDERRLSVYVYAVGETVAVFATQGSAQLRHVDVLAHAGEGAGEGGRLTAPMPGKVVAFLVEPGQSVRRGQALAVMEAMKMEHTLNAPSDGVVKGLRFAAGEQVAEGESLLDFEAV